MDNLFWVDEIRELYFIKVQHFISSVKTFIAQVRTYFTDYNYIKQLTTSIRC